MANGEWQPGPNEPAEEEFEDSSLEELLQGEEREFEWLISPEHFVDFWIASIFLLVGTWQLITMFFLLVK